MDSKSQSIYHDLLSRITRGDLAGKTSLPTEEVLTKQYDCSRPTLRKALNELKQAGIVNTVRGSGVYITVPAGLNGPADGGNLFAIIFPDLGPGHFSGPICSLLAQYTSAHGDSLVWGGYISPKSAMLKTDTRRICERYISQKIAGLFFSPFEYHEKAGLINREIAAIISGAGIPIVLIDSNIQAYPAANEFDLVSMDHIHASYILTEHIIAQGFRRIFFLAPPDSRHTIKLRLIGYHAALIAHDLPPEGLVESSDGDAALLSHFIRSKKPDALICSNDITAIGVINSLEKLGLQVPGDLAVAGFDYLSKAIPFVRPITSIEQPMEAIAQTALSLMLDRIEDPKKTATHITFPGKLISEITTARSVPVKKPPLHRVPPRSPQLT
ncbi:MAG: GntR family transcriptional regulator [Spirochaetaceae bacterium]|jgi:LacI family transcriptional regulator|nr:GntR family transcriptional regulator [Spirochaetaceae bacterium]